MIGRERGRQANEDSPIIDPVKNNHAQPLVDNSEQHRVTDRFSGILPFRKRKWPSSAANIKTKPVSVSKATCATSSNETTEHALILFLAGDATVMEIVDLVQKAMGSESDSSPSE